MVQAIQKAIETGKIKKINELVQEALDSGVDAGEILNGMIETMGVVGDKFQRNELFVPEMLAAGMAMKRGVGVLRGVLTSEETGKNGKFIIGTVAGDLHDIGKNLVALMVESAGFEVIDLGVDVPVSKFVEALQQNEDCKLVGISALLTTTMAAMKDTVEAIEAAGLHDRVKIMVGGAPVTPEFAAEIGADIYTPDAATAASRAKEVAAQ